MELKALVTELKAKGSMALLVTGPQRSGTRIAAHILAAELGYRYVDEDEYGIHDYTKAQWLICQEYVVVQGPALSHLCHKFKLCDVVFVRRSMEDILASEERVHWRTDYGGANLKAEQDKYLNEFGKYSENIADLKYFIWDTYQKEQLAGRGYDLDYESLKGSPLWRTKDQRQQFQSRQWQ